MEAETAAADPGGVILVTGASGYVGGRLLAALEGRGRRVRCLARRPEFLWPRVGPGTEVVAGDVLDGGSLGPGLRGVDTAYYLVHSLGADRGFAAEDRRGALNFAAAARAAGVRRIVYLGGLGHGADLSPHLASRQEVGALLASTGVPVIELRASIIIGSGSFSFEMIRALVDKLPAMVVPRWATLRAQPIAIEDVLAYLLAALDLPAGTSRVYEIGGPDQVSYLDIMRAYARQRGLRRLMVPVPLLTPRLSSWWLGLVTPVYARVGRKLIRSLCNETVVRDTAALRDFPVRPRGVAEAVARALAHEDREFAQTRWSDAVSSAGSPRGWAGARFGSRIVDSRERWVPLPPDRAFGPIQRLGGGTGWYAANWLWRLRGAIDLLAGGVGLRRGRPHPVRLAPGDAVDFWRVERFEPGSLLQLAAEMRLPGRAWLQFEVVPGVDQEGRPGSWIRQTAVFDPAGLGGLLYWYALYPIHQWVFRRMLRGIARTATRSATVCPDFS